MTPLNWNHLRIFGAIVEQGGVTRAAQVLGMSQPAVSQTLQRLEAAMDQPLVRRDGRGFGLTPLGEAVHANVRDMQGAAERIGRAMAVRVGKILVEKPLQLRRIAIDGAIRQAVAICDRIADARHLRSGESHSGGEQRKCQHYHPFHLFSPYSFSAAQAPRHHEKP